ncbi:hypothetical protein ACFE04_018902 [Oxalis oulophora]
MICAKTGIGPFGGLRVGCGAGNTVYPLTATYPDVFVHACDFSPRAVNLVKSHKDFSETRVSAFVCDPTRDDLTQNISPSSVDIVTMIFVLSAVSPEKMALILHNIRKVLKPNGHVLFRDYATGDLAQERLTSKDQKISENFYVRGDGTRAFYFSNDFLTSLFKESGFEVEELDVCCKQVENRSRELLMNRRWVQAVFRFPDNMKSEKRDVEQNSKANENNVEEPLEVDISDCLAFDMFGISACDENEVMEVKLRDRNFKIKALSKEYQHTCKSTGLMVWESTRLMADVLERNQDIVAGKRVLELGCGCAGICSMVAAQSADLVVATDGDPRALELLSQNVTSNLSQTTFADKLITQRLEWGNREDIESIKEVVVHRGEGYEVIIGTDVTYNPEAVMPLFATSKELINSSGALILCHIFRQVDEASLLSAASHFGFRLVDKWPQHDLLSPAAGNGIIDPWFSTNPELNNCIPNTALHIIWLTFSTNSEFGHSLSPMKKRAMEDYNNSRSYLTEEKPPSSLELWCYSASYAQSQMDYNTANNRDSKIKKGQTSSSSKSWRLDDPEFQRKKRVASYKMYSVEGKVKGTFRRSFRWLKDRYTKVVYGWY